MSGRREIIIALMSECKIFHGFGLKVDKRKLKRVHFSLYQISDITWSQ